MKKIYKYFVEGECEQKLINALKTPPSNYLVAGKVEVFNFTKERITPQRIAVLKRNTVIILVYDIDVKNTEILEENIKRLKTFGFKIIYHIQSINNFEDEIVYSTSIKNIDELYNTNNVSEFKSSFLHQGDILLKLSKNNFDPNKIWSRINTKRPFSKYSNIESIKIIRNK